jgi:Flp pilus assembly pilin Flp
MRTALQRSALDRYGATAIEYAMIAFFVSIAAFTALVSIGSDVSGLFNRISASF